MDKLDVILSIIDIIICIGDICLMCYLFFYKFPHEQKKKFVSRIDKRPGRVTLRPRYFRK